MPPSFRPPDFRLRDEDGRRVSFAGYRGRLVIVSFMYPRCRQTCPLMAHQIKGALDDLNFAVPVLAISVDPAVDTERSARAFLRRQVLAGRMHFLVGGASSLMPLWRAYGIAPQSRRRGHSSFVFVVDGHGYVRVRFPADQLTPEDLAHDLRQLRSA